VAGSEAGESGEAPLIGVVALQGGFAAHERMLRRLGASVREVRVPADLAGPPALDGLVWPGGESTTMTLAVEREGLAEPLRAFAASGTPVFGTCAGLIMLDREHLGLMDLTSRRNAFGRQAHSFEADLSLPGVDGGPLRAVFIRAPWIEDVGADVTVLAEVDGHPVAAQQGNLLAVSFHPELSDDPRLHARFLELVAAARAARR
jgi:pyridoxal 5'-phosphate synthase pdxT subunit